MIHFVRGAYKKTGFKLACGKTVSTIQNNDRIGHFSDETTCKDCLNEMILTKQASIMKQKRAIEKLAKKLKGGV